MGGHTTHVQQITTPKRDSPENNRTIMITFLQSFTDGHRLAIRSLKITTCHMKNESGKIHNQK
jgi:hypothetical protein